MTTIGSLFSGIGGLERGVEAAVPGARVVWQAESDPHARAVLVQHYPDVRRYNDVREIDAEADRVDIICGGFPCQDISLAGAGAGIDGPRSGLWSEYARIVRVLRPGLVFIENVAALLSRGLDRVLGDLSACGYDAVWETFRASDVGAPHRRDRLFVLAYANGEAGRRASRDAIVGYGAEAVRPGQAQPGRRSGDVADPDRLDGHGRERDEGRRSPRRDAAAGNGSRGDGSGMADPVRRRQRQGQRDVRTGQPDADGSREGVADADSSGRQGQVGDGSPGTRGGHAALRGEQVRCYIHRFPPGPDQIQGWDGPQPAVRRSDDGVPGRSHRLRLLGNAVVPQQAMLAFLTLLAAADAESTARAA